MSVGTALGSVDEAEARRRLEALADELRVSGELRSHVWHRIFTRTWRHVFVPQFFVKDDPQDWRAPWRIVDGSDPDHRSEWLDGVYSNETLITELKEQPVPEELGGGTTQVITSSSTLPGLMLRMLEALSVEDDNRVLEIGTGTGYNAALLSGRVGDGNVTSMDIGPELVGAARRRLAECGLHPNLVSGNGDCAAPDQAPFDRIIATCGLTRIPYTWVQQTRPGGVILANLLGPLMPGALARLTVFDNGTAVGPFRPGFAAFMPLRDDPDGPHQPPPTPRLADDDGSETLSWLSPHPLHPIGRSNPWSFFVQTVLPGLHAHRTYLHDDDVATKISTPDGSWALVAHTPLNSGYRTIQGGARRLWDLLETAHRQWIELERPGWERFGLTVMPEQQWVWLDSPDGEHRWPIA